MATLHLSHLTKGIEISSATMLALIVHHNRILRVTNAVMLSLPAISSAPPATSYTNHEGFTFTVKNVSTGDVVINCDSADVISGSGTSITIPAGGWIRLAADTGDWFIVEFGGFKKAVLATTTAAYSLDISQSQLFYLTLDQSSTITVINPPPAAERGLTRGVSADVYLYYTADNLTVSWTNGTVMATAKETPSDAGITVHYRLTTFDGGSTWLISEVDRTSIYVLEFPMTHASATTISPDALGGGGTPPKWEVVQPDGSVFSSFTGFGSSTLNVPAGNSTLRLKSAAPELVTTIKLSVTKVTSVTDQNYAPWSGVSSFQASVNPLATGLPASLNQMPLTSLYAHATQAPFQGVPESGLLENMPAQLSIVNINTFEASIRQAAVDQCANEIYQWALNNPLGTVNVGIPHNIDPTGIYQFSATPSTPLEKIYWLENTRGWNYAY